MLKITYAYTLPLTCLRGSHNENLREDDAPVLFRTAYMLYISTKIIFNFSLIISMFWS